MYMKWEYTSIFLVFKFIYNVGLCVCVKAALQPANLKRQIVLRGHIRKELFRTSSINIFLG